MSKLMNVVTAAAIVCILSVPSVGRAAFTPSGGLQVAQVFVHRNGTAYVQFASALSVNAGGYQDQGGSPQCVTQHSWLAFNAESAFGKNALSIFTAALLSGKHVSANGISTAEGCWSQATPTSCNSCSIIGGVETLSYVQLLSN